jgi:hypothetical protein
MVAYDYEVLQSKDLFTEEIFKMVETLPTLLTFDAALNDFISQLLILSSIDRPNIRTICMHPWLEVNLDVNIYINMYINTCIYTYLMILRLRYWMR